jgi:hypothetical protein
LIAQHQNLKQSKFMAIKKTVKSANNLKANAKPKNVDKKTGVADSSKSEIKKPPVVFLQTQRELSDIQKVLGCPVLSYFKPSGTSIWSRDLYAIWEVLKHIGKVDKLAIYVRSDGGSGMISLRIINLLRDYVKELIILAPSECASAATMLALGCDEIHLGPLSSLSAVDSSLIHALSPVDSQGNPVSVSQDELWRVLKLWKEFHLENNIEEVDSQNNLQTDFSQNVDKNLSENLKFGFKSSKKSKNEPDQEVHTMQEETEVMENPYKYLYKYVHPLVFGAIDRSRSLSVQLCKEILEYHINDPKKIQDISNKLNYTYPAHGYPITSKEAKKIGLNIKPIAEEIQEDLNNLQLLYGELTDDMITDYDNNSYHNQCIYSVVETIGVQIIYQNNFDKFYRETEKRYITLNDLSGWYKTVPIGQKAEIESGTDTDENKKSTLKSLKSSPKSTKNEVLTNKPKFETTRIYI